MKTTLMHPENLIEGKRYDVMLQDRGQIVVMDRMRFEGLSVVNRQLVLQFAKRREIHIISWKIIHGCATH